jgi:dTDP-4-dehydrorhamnose reductase
MIHFLNEIGWLGQQVCEMILQEHSLLDSIDLYAGYHTSEPFWVSPDKRILLNLSDKNKIEKVIENIMPDMIIHLAAITSPGLCEKIPIEAYEINSPVEFIEIVKKHVPNCLFIFASTDLIYDGESAPYSIINNRPSERGNLIQQEDEVMHDERPETIYGKTKLLFEESVLTLRNGVVLRLSNMLGKPYAYRLNGVKFMHFLYESYKSKAFIGLRYDEKRSFVFVNDVLKIIAKFIDHGLLNSCANKRFLPRTLTREGDNIKNVITMPIEPSLRIFNIGGPVGISRLHLASLLAEVLNNDLELVDFSTKLPLSRSVNPLISNDYKKNNDKSDTKIHIDTHSTTKLKIDNEINLIKWSVHATSNQESIKESGVLNPRDVTMNVDYTETFFAMKMTPPRDTIKFLISYFDI